MSVLSGRRRQMGRNNLSFLDVISAGFGAIVLLFVITQYGEPAPEGALEPAAAATARELEQRLPELAARERALQTQVSGAQRRLEALGRTAESLSARLDAVPTSGAATLESLRRQASELESAKQSLTRAMERLLGSDFKRRDNTVGGIPVDSEYVIFVIDTSGSMQRNWPRVVEKVGEALSVYPRVRGVQVLNDMGGYLFPQQTGNWIEDNPTTRHRILQRLRSWQSSSNSSPVEGVRRAIRTFAADDKHISIYVFGDEFTGRSIQMVLDALTPLDPGYRDGRRLVRIHAVGFPTQYVPRGVSTTGMRYALLMRQLTGAFDGAFVGLRARPRSR